MKARDLLKAVERYAEGKHLTPEELLKELPDDKLKTAILVAAKLFSSLKKEAIRRGTWDEMKKMKVT